MGHQDLQDEFAFQSQDIPSHLSGGDATLPQIVQALPIALSMSVMLWILAILAAVLEFYYG